MNKKHKTLAYLVLRIGLGVNFLLHGAVRLPALNKFANAIASGFENTWMPLAMAKTYAYGIPFIEILVGAMILFGIYTQKALFIGGLFMSTLIAGKVLQQDWNTVGLQMVYVLIFYILLRDAELNSREIVAD